MHVSFLVLRMQVDASLNEDADLSQKMLILSKMIQFCATTRHMKSCN